MKIRNKLLISFLLMTLIPIVIASSLVYHKTKDVIIDEALEELQLISNYQLEVVSSFIHRLEEEATALTHLPSTIDFIHKLQKDDHDSQQDRPFLNFLQNYAKDFHFHDVILLSMHGTILYSLETPSLQSQSLLEHQKDITGLVHTFQNTKTLLEPSLSSFDHYDPKKPPLVYLTVPIFDQNIPIGILAVAINSSRIVNLFDDTPLLRNSGEMVIASRKNDKAYFISPSRLDPHSIYSNEKNLAASPNLPIHQAVHGQTGHGLRTDYRDKLVIAVWRYIPPLEWGLVLKIDVDEVLAPLYHWRDWIIFYTGLGMIIIALLVLWVSQTLTKPIQSLQTQIKKIQPGEFDQHIEIHTKDEIGHLANSFNTMLDTLKESTTSIDRLNEEVIQRKEAEGVKSRFLSMITHELRTPLAIIKESLDCILEKIVPGDLTEEQTRFLKMSLQNADHLHLLINDILDIHKLEAGKYELTLSTEDLNQIIRDVITPMQVLIDNKHLTLNLNLDTDLAHLPLDKTRIIQVLENLLSNAIKYTDKGSITIRTFSDDGKVICAIQDTGEGIKQEDSKKLFQSFTQINRTPGQKVEGTGLGLAICKGIIESHHGDIWINSTPGEGTTVSFSLLKTHNPS